MAVNLLEVPFNPSVCAICNEALNKYPTYTLPECKHTFHTHCIITWFRHNPSSQDGVNNRYSYLHHRAGGMCPCCCKTAAPALSNTRRRYMPYTLRILANKTVMIKKKELEKYKNKPKKLENLLNKYDKLENSYNEAVKNVIEYNKSMKNMIGNYDEIKNKYKQLYDIARRERVKYKNIRDSILNYPVIPIIVPTFIDIN